MSEFIVLPKACSNNLPDKVKIGPIVFGWSKYPAPLLKTRKETKSRCMGRSTSSKR